MVEKECGKQLREYLTLSERERKEGGCVRREDVGEGRRNVELL